MEPRLAITSLCNVIKIFMRLPARGYTCREILMHAVTLACYSSTFTTRKERKWGGEGGGVGGREEEVMKEEEVMAGGGRESGG